MNEDEKKVYKTTVMIWFGTLAAIIICGVIIAVLIVTQQTDFPNTSLSFEYIFYGLALLELPFISILKNFVFKLRAAKGDEKSLIEAFRLSSIVGFNMAELPAILGLVLFFIGRAFVHSYILIAYAVVLWIVNYPNASQLSRLPNEI